MDFDVAIVLKIPLLYLGDKRNAIGANKIPIGFFRSSFNRNAFKVMVSFLKVKEIVY